MKKVFILVIFVLLVSGCFENVDPIQTEQTISFQFMKSASIDIASAICRVSAEDMDTITVNLSVSSTSVSGEITKVPYGEDRLFEIMCYNSAGIMNYYGSELANINSISPTISITISEVDSTANVTIIGHFGDNEYTEEKIVFSADYSGNYDIYIMDIDGTNIEQLTTSSFNEYMPQLSPDRSQVLFQRSSGIGTGDYPYILNLETKELIQLDDLNTLRTHFLNWHSSGDKIIFSSTGLNGQSSDVYEYNLETKVITPLILNNVSDWTPSYTNDDKILFSSEDTTVGVFRGYIANSDGSSPRLINPEYSTEERSLKICPTDNNLILYSGRFFDYNSSVQFGLYLTDLSDSTVQGVIVTQGVNEGSPHWSPDANWIVYERRDINGYGIYKVRPDGSDETEILNSTGNERYPHWR